MRNTEKYIPQSLGLVALRKRVIQPGGEKFDRLFPRPKNADEILNPDGSVQDTIEHCIKIVKSTLSDTKHLAKILARPTKQETCRAIFDFFYKNYQYKEDTPGVEQLRRPSRAWQDRKNGIDCDCLSISISSTLHNLKIPHFFRVVKMYHRNYYQHIYVIVPKCSTSNMNIRSNYIVIDPVLDKFDYEAPNITFKTDIQMGIPIQYLNGISSIPALGREFDGLGQGLGCASGDGLYKDYLRRQKLQLINTRNAIERNPNCVAKVYQPKVLCGMYDELIGAWDDEVTREFTLEKLSQQEEKALQPELMGLGSVINQDFSNEEMEEILEGLGILKKARAAIKQVATKAKNTGVFTKVKNAVKTVKTAAKKAGSGALKVAKNVAKATIKYNPLVTTARLGYLAAMKVNFSKLASRAYWGYFTEAQAKSKGVSAAYWKDAKALQSKLENMFVTKLQGKAENLKSAILSGRGAKKASELATKGSLNGLGEVTLVGTITSAIAFLTPIMVFAKNLFSKHKGDPEEAEQFNTSEPIEINEEEQEEFEKDESGNIVLNSDGTPKVKGGFFSKISTPVMIGLGLGTLAIIGGIAYAVSKPKSTQVVPVPTAIGAVKKVIPKHRISKKKIKSINLS